MNLWSLRLCIRYSFCSFCSLSEAHDHVVITLPALNKKCPMNSSLRGVPAVLFHNRGPSLTENTEI